MVKTALIFVTILLFSTCTLIQAETGSLQCKKDSDCAMDKCPDANGVKCVDNVCVCPMAFPNSQCNVAACTDYCAAKGQQAYACLWDQCYCRKPPM